MEEEKDAEDEMSLMANRLTVKETQRVCTEPDEIMQNLAYTPFDMVSTPISPAKGWTIDVPQDALECTILLFERIYSQACAYPERRKRRI